jgi:pentatricopeptide repeat protein
MYMYGIVFKMLETDAAMRMRVDAFHYTSIINACGVNGLWEKAVEMLDACKTNHPKELNSHVYSAAMLACIKCKQYDKAVTIFDEVLNNSAIKKDAYVFNIGFSGIVKNGAVAKNHQRVVEIYTMMENLEVKPDYVTFLAVMKSCDVAGDWELANALLNKMKSVRWLQPDIDIYTLVASAHLRAGKVDDVLMIIDDVRKLSNVEYVKKMNDTSDISSPFLIKNPKNKFPMIKQYHVVKPPDALLLSMGLVACSVGNAAKYGPIAQQLLDVMIEADMKPSYSCFLNAIKALDRSGNYSAAVSIYRKAYLAGYVRSKEAEHDLESLIPADAIVESTAAPQIASIKIDMRHLYETEMIRTRINSVFYFILKCKLNEKKSSPGIMLLIGKNI